MGVTSQEQRTREEFNDKIARRDSDFAIAAAAAQYQPAQYWDVVIKADGLLAIGTRGAGVDHRQITRQAVNTHIQEAAKGQPHREDRQCQNRIHHALCENPQKYLLV
jgi:hypothetical protein